MEPIELARNILAHIPYEPNQQQLQLVAALGRYLAATPDGSDRVFLLNGYAGTGKTTIIGSVVKALSTLGVHTVLLAPTGRAAKVLSASCHHQAFTIHRHIYLGDSAGGATVVENRLPAGSVIIVDEASMIGGSGDGGNLLQDLIYYVYSGIACRLILLGDTAQLPPVGCTSSPAMNKEVLHSYGLKVTRVVITETSRQKADSGILFNATWLRRAMLLDPLPAPVIYASAFPGDIRVIEEQESLIDYVYSDYTYGDTGVADTIIVTRSNRRATEFNHGVRRMILDYEEELVTGERLLVVKNNYFWIAKLRRMDFIANGDVAVVERIIGTEEKYSLRFADVELYLPDRDLRLECKIMLDTLSSLTAGLDADVEGEFMNLILNDPELFTPAQSLEQRMLKLRSNPYFSALRVKYAYCVTCHKAQGGQWPNVYIDTGYIPAEATGLDLYRWLYTATTRATRRLNYILPPFTIK